jgi:hypothetical protein
MELWDPLENLVVLVNQVHQDSLVLQELRETWAHQETRVALDFKVLEESLENQECPVNQERWDHLVKMEAMEKRADQEHLVLQVHRASQDPEDNLVSMEVLDHMDQRD